MKHEFQIICCSESWLKNSTKDRYTPKGFTHVFDYREKKRGGGTSIFINDSVQYEERKDLKLDLHSDLTNSCFIELDKHTINNRRNIVLGCLYKPPHVSIEKFNEKFNDICFSLSNTNKDVYMLGDFNINLGDSCSNNHHTQELKNILFSNSFVPLIHKPTRINNNSATIIDNIFTNVSIEQIVAAGILATKAYSDHFPIFAILKNISREKRDKTTVNRIFSQKTLLNSTSI